MKQTKILIKGGYKTVATIYDRDNLPAELLENLMLVAVEADNTIYQYKNNAWSPFEAGAKINDNIATTGTTYSSNKITELHNDLGVTISNLEGNIQNIGTDIITLYNADVTINTTISNFNDSLYEVETNLHTVSVDVQTLINDVSDLQLNTSDLTVSVNYNGSLIDELDSRVYNLENPVGDGSFGITDGDKGDITVSGSGTTWTINGTTNRTFKTGINTAGSTSTLQADGTDTNINLNLKVKGTGNVKLDGVNYVTAENKLLMVDSAGNIVTNINPTNYLTAANLGNIVYVSPTGNNTTGLRGRIDKPFATGQAATDVAQTGDVIYFMPGSYTQNIDMFGSRGWSSATALRFVLDNVTLTGTIGCGVAFGGAQAYSVIGIGTSKIIGSIGTGHHDHQIKDVKNLEITDSIKQRVIGIVQNCKITTSGTTQFSLETATYEKCELTSTNPCQPWQQGTVKFTDCIINLPTFGEFVTTVGNNGSITFERCKVLTTDDAKDMFAWADQGIRIFARNSVFEFGKKFYQSRQDNSIQAEESFYFQNCNFYSRVGSVLITKTTHVNSTPLQKYEILNCISNVTAGDTPTVSANFIQTSFTNF